MAQIWIVYYPILLHGLRNYRSLIHATGYGIIIIITWRIMGKLVYKEYALMHKLNNK